MSEIVTKNLNLWYGDFHALKDVNASFEKKRITAIIGPSGCGKSTLLRVFNRMNDFVDGVRTSGEVIIEGQNILNGRADLVALRKKVGMVFQRPNPFPLSVYENIVFGERIHGGSLAKSALDAVVEKSLKSVLLWDELKDRLHASALSLSLEQKQRLCVARLIAVKPDVLLMDEPFASVDAQTRMTLQEELTRIWEQRRPTVLFITHDVAEAVFLANRVVVLSKGTVLDDIPVDLPRPRVWDTLIEHESFKALSAKVLHQVRSA